MKSFKTPTGAEKNKKQRKWLHRIIIAFGIFCAISLIGGCVSAILDDGETDTAGTEPSAESQTAETEKPKKEDPEKALKKDIEKVVGVENLKTFNYVPSNNFSLIKFKGKENLSHDMTVKGMYMDMFNILKNIKDKNKTDIDFNVIYPMQDTYGNVSEDIVIKATFTNETIQKINFENALWENIPKLADEWWNHQALNLKNN